ncbi:MAG: ABC transporter permease [Dehalococcoidales bacterium]|nr:ABC transporter permease [Dehalococcoidales bacterium]
MRKWLDPISTARSGVITHKLRSFLTILGIVIGVGAVITLMSVGRGAERDILSNIQNLGSNLITISPGSFTFGGVRGGVSQTLTSEDAKSIAEQVNNISAIAPSYSSNLQLVANGNNTSSQVTGTTPEYLSVNNLELSTGTFFSYDDYDRSNKVAVLGSEVAETLFGDTDPIGQQIRMGTIIVRVIGVLESKGMSFSSPDSTIIIPLTVMQQTVAQPRTTQGDRIVSSIALTVTDEDHTQQVIDDITSVLRTNHHLAATSDDDFRIMSTEEIAATLSETIGTLTLLLGAIAAISLLVGGIGVMNIMLVSVLERTREIGIRKALGARQSDIWGQFLIEAAFLSLAGGIIGVAAGWGIAYLIDSIGLLSTVVSADIVIMAVGVSVGIGLFFGFYPAWNASRLNPIEALRSD